MIFLFEFKVVIKQWRQLETSTIHLAQELLTNIQCSGVSRSFAKKMRLWRWRAQWLASGSDSDPLRSSSWSSYNYSRSVWGTQCRPFYGHLAFEANWKVKKLDKRVPHELTEKKNHCFEESSSLILCKNNEPFLDQIVTCNKKWILYNQQWPLSRRSSKALPKSLSLSGGLLLVWSTRAFWIPAKLLPLRSTLTANPWNALKTATPVASIGQQNGPNSPFSAQTHVAQPKLQKLNELGYEDLPHPPYSPRLSPTDYHFFKHLDNLCRENTPTANRRQKIPSNICWILKLEFLHYRNK